MRLRLKLHAKSQMPFEDAKDLRTSKSWAQIQRPLIGSMDENLQPRDVRDDTVINVSQKK
jgi:hypothetical protein